MCTYIHTVHCKYVDITLNHKLPTHALSYIYYSMLPMQIGTYVRTILPLPCGRIDVAKELIICDSFGIEILPDWLPLHIMVCLV